MTLAIPFAIALAGPNYVTPRNVLGVWVPLAIVVALGAGVGSSGRFGAVITSAIGVVCISIVIATAADQRLQRDNWEALLETLGPPGAGRVIAVLDAPTKEAIVRYYRPWAAEPQSRAARQIVVIGARTEVVPSPAAGMEPAGTRSIGPFAAARYDAPQPVQIPDRIHGRADVAVLADGQAPP